MPCYGPSLIVALVIPGLLFGDEAIRKDGVRTRGTLSLTANGNWKFTTSEAESPVDELDLVRFTPKPADVKVGPLIHQVRLIRGQVIHGQLLKLDAKHLHVRTAWHDSLPIPRALVERVANLPRTQPALFDSFDGDLSKWKTEGEPKSADSKVTLQKPGQKIEAVFRVPIEQGRLNLQLQGGRSRSRVVSLGLTFREGEKISELRVELTGPTENWTVVSPTNPKSSASISRDDRPHRLAMEFLGNDLGIFVDDLVLWTQKAPPGKLHSIRFLTEGEGDESTQIDDVLVSRRIPVDPTRTWADLTLDGVRSVDGDETFGVISGLSSAGMSLEVRSKKSVVPWSEIAEFAFRRTPIDEREIAGEFVRVRLKSFEGAPDLLDGAVTGFSEKALTLQHATLGELKIPRERIEQIRLGYRGRSLPVDATPRHLGEKSGFGYAVPKPEGIRFHKEVRIGGLTNGVLVIDAARLGPTSSTVELWIQGQLRGRLNEQVDRASDEVREFRFALPELKTDPCELELRVRPGEDGRMKPGVDLRGIRLEIRERR